MQYTNQSLEIISISIYDTIKCLLANHTLAKLKPVVNTDQWGNNLQWTGQTKRVNLFSPEANKENLLAGKMVLRLGPHIEKMKSANDCL